MKDHIHKAEELARFCIRLYEKNYIAGVEGNLSVRLPENRIMITPGRLNKGFITPQDMVVCDSDGAKLEGVHQPSSEFKIHLAAYKHRTDVNAVCHAHPVFATAFSLAGKQFDEAFLPEQVIALGMVPLVKYATPGSDLLASNLTEVVG
jgi:L-fuculose-phosphate aldolase